MVRFSLINLQNSIAKFLLLDSRENIQTVLIPLAGKRDGLFPEQSITSEYKNKYEERTRSKVRREKNLPGSLTAVCVFPLFHQHLGHVSHCAAAHYHVFSFSLKKTPKNQSLYWASLFCLCLLYLPPSLSLPHFLCWTPLCQLTHHKPEGGPQECLNQHN